MPGMIWDLGVRDKASPAFARLAGVTDKAASASARMATAQLEASKVSSRLRIAELELAAATERHGIVAKSTTASISKQASAEIGLIRANQGLAEAQAASTAAATKAATSHSAAGRAATVGAAATKKLTLPIIALGLVSADVAAKFQKSTSVYVTAAGESQKNLSTVRKGIEGVAESTGTSIDQLTAGEYAVEKAGYRGASGITLLKASAQGAAEENANLSDVIAGATSVMASYHLGTDKSVQVINALKTGAGSAKTTMEEYVKSLSTVIPIASAAGVALPQVLGAVSTLTQHGTTPAEATQELAFTLRNLQAPSNVAISAMNQIGISSVDISKNLGKRGLTGTFDYIASKLPKTGLVYLSTMKNMESGTKDLTAMQSKMSPDLALLSKGFLDGSVTAKTYRTDIRNMGADGFAQGSAFLTLAAKVRGYNDSLKNGTPAQKTMAAELKSIYGGANGLNTVLQLGGKNLDGFQTRTDAVGASLSATGKDVEGWKATSQLASIEAGKFEESLHVLAINAGTALLPTLTKLASGATGVVHSFEGLSHTQKEVAGWSIAVLAGIGPVLAIGARLVGVGERFAMVGTRMATMAGASEASAARVGVSMSRISGAIGGAAIGVAVGSLTAKSSTAVKALGVLGSAAAGAALGSAGGPLGIAIGGLAGGLGALATQFLGAGSAADRAIKPTDDFTQAMLRDKDAVGSNTSALVVNKLEKEGAYDAAHKLGISTATLTQAALGNKAALTQVASAQKNSNLMLVQGYGSTNDNSKATAKYREAQSTLKTALGDVAQTLKVNKTAADNVRDGLAATATKASQAKIELNGLKSSATNAHGGLINLGSSAHALGTNLAALSASHTVNVSTSAASNAISSLSSQISALFNRMLNPPSVPAVGKATAKSVASGHGGIIGAGKASGGSAPEGFFSVNERGPEIFHKQGSRLDIMSHSQSKAFIASTGAQFPGFASGTDPNAVYRVGKGYGFQGSYYGGKTAAKDARSARADYLHGEQAQKLYAKRQTPDQTDTKAALSGLGTLAHAAGTSLADMQGGIASLKDAAKAMGMSSTAWTKVVGATKTVTLAGRSQTVNLAQASALRDSIRNQLGTGPAASTAYDRLATAKDAYSGSQSGVSSAVGAFDITQVAAPAQMFNDVASPALSASTELTALTAAASKATAYAGLLKTLIKEGIPRSIVEQLAAAGPSAYDQAKALSAATPKQVLQFQQQSKLLASAGSTAGTTVANAYYKTGVTSAQGIVNGLLSQESTLNTAITKLGDSMIKTLKTKLKIHSPSKVTRDLGQFTGAGFVLGLQDQIPHVARVSSDLGGAVTPSAAPHGGNSGGGTTTHVTHNWTINEADNGMETAHRVMRRLAFAGP